MEENEKRPTLFEVKEWLEKTAEMLVDDPSDLGGVSHSTDEMGVFFAVKVGRREAGKLIGKEGRISNSLKELLRAMGYKRGSKISLKIDAPKFERRNDDPRGSDNRSRDRDNY